MRLCMPTKLNQPCVPACISPRRAPRVNKHLDGDTRPTSSLVLIKSFPRLREGARSMGGVVNWAQQGQAQGPPGSLDPVRPLRRSICLRQNQRRIFYSSSSLCNQFFSSSSWCPGGEFMVNNQRNILKNPAPKHIG